MPALVAVLLAHGGLLLLLLTARPPAQAAEAPALMIQVLPPAAPALAPAPPEKKAEAPVPPRRPQPVPRRPKPVLSSEVAGPATVPLAPAVAAPAPPAEAPPAAAQPVSEVRFDAAYLQNPAPVYPPLSRRLGEEGKVVLRVHVAASGRPEQIEVKSGSGSPRLDQAATDAVWRWRFVPARRGDEAVAAWVLVPVVFNLRG